LSILLIMVNIFMVKLITPIKYKKKEGKNLIIKYFGQTDYIYIKQDYCIVYNLLSYLIMIIIVIINLFYEVFLFLTNFYKLSF
jgi:hypothetical protein